MTPRPVPSAIVEQFPYRLEYGMIKAFWSEQASRWAQLRYFDFARNSLVSMPGTGASIPFTRQPIYLFARVARSGTFRLTADVVGKANTPLPNRTLRIVSDAGFDEQLALRGEKDSLAIPLPEGTTRIRVSLTDQPSAAQTESSLRIIRWAIEAGSDR
jgi:hypothetical protein